MRNDRFTFKSVQIILLSTIVFTKPVAFGSRNLILYCIIIFMDRDKSYNIVKLILRCEAIKMCFIVLYTSWDPLGMYIFLRDAIVSPSRVN